MKIETKILTKFLEEFSLSAENQIGEALFKFETEGLKVGSNDGQKQVFSTGWLKPEAFKEYSAIGNVGLNDLANVIKVLGRFDEFVTITKQGNLMTVAGSSKTSEKKVDVELISENFLSTEAAEPKLTFTDTFVIGGKLLGEVVADAEMNKDAELIIATEPKKVMFSNTGKYRFNTTLVSPVTVGNARVSFGQPFVNAVANLIKGDTKELEFSLANDYPVKIVKRTENSVVTVIVAPRVKEE